jgi:hypothetical protein
VDAAGVVADHPADRAAVVTGWVWSEGQVMFFGSVAEVVEDDSGLHAGEAAIWVDLEDVAHVLREIENHRDVAALSGQRRTASATEKRRAEFAANRDRGDNVVRIARQHYADRDLAVIRAVSGVESAARIVEADVSANISAQGFVQPQGIVHS